MRPTWLFDGCGQARVFPFGGPAESLSLVVKTHGWLATQFLPDYGHRGSHRDDLSCHQVVARRFSTAPNEALSMCWLL